MNEKSYSEHINHNLVWKPAACHILLQLCQTHDGISVGLYLNQSKMQQEIHEQTWQTVFAKHKHLFNYIIHRSCRVQTNLVTFCIIPTVLLTKEHTLCEKLLTTLAMVNVLWQKMAKFKVWKSSTLIFGDTHTLLQHSVPKAESSLYVKNEINRLSSFDRTSACNITTNSKVLKNSHHTITTPLLLVICHPVARIDIACLCTKFDEFRFSHCSDMIGAPKIFNGSHDLTMPLSGMVCHP